MVVLLLGLLFSLSPFASAATALLCGVVIAIICGNPYMHSTENAAKTLLALSIVGLGAGMNLITVGHAGLTGFAITFVSISLTLLLCLGIGRLVKSDKKTSILISVGTAICGGSAIAAVAPVLKAKPHNISVALGTVFILNAVALFLFPTVGHYFDLTQQQFGLWSALAIHDTSSVVGTSLQYGPEALQEAVTVKLARALWIVPLTLGFGFWYRGEKTADTRAAKRPWFILGFIIMAALVTWIPELQTIGHTIEAIARRCLVVTLYLIGVNLTLETLKSVGVRPFLQGIASWLIVSITALCAVKWLIFP